MSKPPSASVDTRVIFCGDNLEGLSRMPDGCVDLIYIDPPTPNLSCGGHAAHSPLEWACLEEMAASVEWLVALAQVWAEDGSEGARTK